MSRVVFWDVDTQHDFMKADGKLYVPDAEQIIPNLKRLTDFAHANRIRIIASADDHVPGHRELSDAPDFRETFPEHCMRGTPGQQKIRETTLRDPLVIEPEVQERVPLTRQVQAHQGDYLLHKHWFDVFTNANTETVLDALAPAAIVLYGVATDVCDRYAIEGLLSKRPNIRLYAVSDAMKAIHEDTVPALLSDWQRRGVRLVTTEDALKARAA